MTSIPAPVAAPAVNITPLDATAADAAPSDPSSPGTFTIRPRGPFSLEEATMFGFGHRHVDRWDGVMRLAFCLDDLEHQVGAELRQDPDGAVRVTLVGPDAGRAIGAAPPAPDLPAARRQIERILSLDHDGRAFLEVGHRDPVIGGLQALAPGLRPPLFHSPYEAAAWSIISARRSARQMSTVRRRLGEQHGARFVLAGEPSAAFPTPAQLLSVDGCAGLEAEKIERLHGVARAALAGRLDAARLRALEPAAAMAELQTIKGIGPFYSALIVVRATGAADVLAEREPRLLAAVGQLYGLGRPATAAELTEISEPWRPFRTWACVLVRAVSGRLAA